MVNAMQQHCAQCLAEVEEGLGYKGQGGETFCGPCYFALWGPKSGRSRSDAERVRPSARRPAKARGNWLAPGPSAELDPEERVRKALRRQRRT